MSDLTIDIDVDDPWGKVYDKHGQWIKDNILLLLRLYAGQPVDWKSIDHLFIGLGLSLKQLPAVEMAVGDLLSAGRIIRAPGQPSFRYQLPVLERLAAI